MHAGGWRAEASTQATASTPVIGSWWQPPAVQVSADRRTVALTIPGLRPTRGLELWYSVRAADGREVDGLLHGSVNRLPE